MEKSEKEGTTFSGVRVRVLFVSLLLCVSVCVCVCVCVCRRKRNGKRQAGDAAAIEENHTRARRRCRNGEKETAG